MSGWWLLVVLGAVLAGLPTLERHRGRVGPAGRAPGVDVRRAHRRPGPDDPLAVATALDVLAAALRTGLPEARALPAAAAVAPRAVAEHLQAVARA